MASPALGTLDGLLWVLLVDMQPEPSRDIEVRHQPNT
jgi:hypothetical protein